MDRHSSGLYVPPRYVIPRKAVHPSTAEALNRRMAELEKFQATNREPVLVDLTPKTRKQRRAEARALEKKIRREQRPNGYRAK